MADLSIFKLDSETITIKDTTARQTADTANTLATTASGNATTALNKINELESEKADAIISSTSGAIASFQDGAESTAKKLVVNIEPVQEGSGDPSPDNVRPISGWTGATVTRTGKNLLNKADATITGGNAIWGGTAQTFTGFLLKAGTYTLSCSHNVAGFYVSTEDDNIHVAYNRTSTTFTNPKTQAVKIDFYINDVTQSDMQSYDYQLELGSTATAYEPYQGETYDIAFPSEAGTVYGGSLTIAEDGSGVLTVDSELEVFDRILENEIASGLNYLNLTRGSVDTVGNYTRISFAGPSDRAKYNLISSTYARKMCNMLSHVFSYADKSAHWYRNTVLYAFFPTSAVGSTKESVITYLKNLVTAGTPLTFWIPFAEPVAYTLTASEIRTLLGQNNIWADAGDTSVTYRADTKLYIDKKFTELRALILEN